MLHVLVLGNQGPVVQINIMFFMYKNTVILPEPPIVPGVEIREGATNFKLTADSPFIQKLAKRREFKAEVFAVIHGVVGIVYLARNKVMEKVVYFEDRIYDTIIDIVDRIERKVTGTVDGVRMRLQDLVFILTVNPLNVVARRLRRFITGTVTRVVMIPQTLMARDVFGNTWLLAHVVGAELRNISAALIGTLWTTVADPIRNVASGAVDSIETSALEAAGLLTSRFRRLVIGLLQGKASLPIDAVEALPDRIAGKFIEGVTVALSAAGSPVINRLQLSLSVGL